MQLAGRTITQRAQFLTGGAAVSPLNSQEQPPIHQAHRSIHLYEMMEKLGIDPNSGILPRLGLRYATALHRCEDCPYKKTCREWLDLAPRSVRSAPHFCPDADILFELQFDQPGHASSFERSVPQ